MDSDSGSKASRLVQVDSTVRSSRERNAAGACQASMWIARGQG